MLTRLAKGILRGWRRAGPQVVSRRPLLNLGCGVRHHQDWTNLDLVPSHRDVLQHDLEQPLPFPEASFEGVYHSHVLEHLPRAAAIRFLGECHRVLRPGGILRVVVPDLEMIARLYLQFCDAAWRGETGGAERHEWMTIELLDQLTREVSGGEMLRFWRRQPLPAADFVEERMGGEFRRACARPAGRAAKEEKRPGFISMWKFQRSGELHRWMYDRSSLRAILSGLGFREIRVCAADQSGIDGFAGFHLDTDPEGRVIKPDSLFMEAVKL